MAIDRAARRLIPVAGDASQAETAIFESTAVADRTTHRSFALVFVVAVGVVFVALAFMQVKGVNGAWYWNWPWRRLKPLHTALWLALPMLPFFAAVRLIERGGTERHSVVLPLSLLMLACFGLQVCAALSHPLGIAHLQAIVESPVATSYYTEALNIANISDWLANFHTAQLQMHAAVQPPGPVLYYFAWLCLVSPHAAAVAGGIALGAFATFGIPLLYVFVGLWTCDRRTRLVACALYALVPAFVVFLPEFDQIYPVFSLLICIAWIRSLRDTPAYAALAGGVLAVATFFTYKLLVLGVFLALYSAYRLLLARGDMGVWRDVLHCCTLAAMSFVLVFVLLWLVTGYDAPRSFMHALAMQETILSFLNRPWRATVLFDLYDFVLGSGILVAPLLLLFVRYAASSVAWERPDIIIPLIGLATIAIVDVSGLVRAETARVWMFLQPFAIAPAASQLMRFGARGRALIFSTQWLVGLTVFCKMAFVEP